MDPSILEKPSLNRQFRLDYSSLLFQCYCVWYSTKKGIFYYRDSGTLVLHVAWCGVMAGYHCYFVIFLSIFLFIMLCKIIWWICYSDLVWSLQCNGLVCNLTGTSFEWIRLQLLQFVALPGTARTQLTKKTLILPTLWYSEGFTTRPCCLINCSWKYCKLWKIRFEYVWIFVMLNVRCIFVQYWCGWIAIVKVFHDW